MLTSIFWITGIFVQRDILRLKNFLEAWVGISQGGGVLFSLDEGGG